MPELPEIAAMKHSLEPLVAMKTVKSVQINDATILQNVSANSLRDEIVGKTILSIEQRGKHLVFVLQDGSKLICHFILTGNLVLLNRKPFYSMIEIGLCDGNFIKIDDARRLMKVWFIKPLAFGMTGVLDKLGPEPLSDSFTLGYLTKLCHYYSRSIKSLLLNQSFVAGIGNCYADEILYSARINPSTVASSLTDMQLHELFDCIKDVLSLYVHACYQSYNPADGLPALENSVRQNCKVHEMSGSKCSKCDEVIKKITVEGKATWLCPSCQR